MYQPPSSIPSGLARVLSAADQINPVTPQGGLSVAASVLAQANKMPGVAGIAQNTATGNAIEMQQQQAAQQALMNQMLAQQKAQQQQPPMMAEGGIASLYAGNMDDFAEGGVVGFAYGGGAEFDTGAADEYQLAQDEERIRRLLEDKKRQEQEFVESRAKATAAATGQTYTPAPTAPISPASPVKTSGATPIVSAVDQERLQILIDDRNRRMVDAANGDPRAQGDVDAINREIALVARGTYPTSDGTAPKTLSTSAGSTAGPTPITNAGIGGLGDMDSVVAAINKLKGAITPSTDTSQYAAELGDYKKLLGERPDFLTPAIANATAAEAAALRRAEREEAVRKENYDPLSLLLQGFAKSSSLAGGPAALSAGKEAYGKAGLEIQARRDAAEELKRNAILAAQRADYNDKIGNTKAALDARKEYETIVERIKSLEATGGAAAAQAAASMYGADQRAEANMYRGLLSLAGKEGKPLPDLDASQMKTFREMAKEDIPDLNPIQSPYFLKYLKANEPELLEKLQSTKWFVNKPKPEELIPLIQAAREERFRELVQQSKFGAAAVGRATPYTVAAQELGSSTR